MTEWDPATEAEAAMRDALRVSDQELYFRILARTELLLPVSADALAGRAPMGWGTWSSGGRTHVLAFTSPDAMRICLAEHAGSARRIAYHELANAWPNHEWWMAVNPGLPIEGYLPPWFVGQLARGDVRIPGRPSGARARGEHASASSGARRFARGYPSDSPFEEVVPDEVLDAEPPPTMRTPGARRATHAAGRNTPGRDGTRRSRRYESAVIDATVIDAEIIESTVLGASALEATIVDATVLDASPVDADVIDATVIDATAESVQTRRSGRATGRISIGGAPQQPVEQTTPAIDRGTPEPSVASDGHPDATVPGEAARNGAGRRHAVPGVNGDAGPARRAAAATEPVAPAAPPKPPFVPANEVETNLLAAATSGQTDNFLSTLLLARVLIPIPAGESPDIGLDNAAFPWRREVVEGQAYLVVFTSPERMAEFMGADTVVVNAKFIQMIRLWPDVTWAFAVNPGSPVGATLPGVQIKALAAWAADVGLTDEEPEEEEYDEDFTPSAPPPATSTIIMQKPIAPSQVDYYLERGYDRASGFVHRATELEQLRQPEKLYGTLGLSYTGSPFERKAEEIYVLRWAAHRGDLYRIPYGGQHEAGMRAMQGWMIERAPFRGNGFAPAERGEVIAEFKVDSIRLPHGAQMWRLTKDGEPTLVAVLDSDESVWRTAGMPGVVGQWDLSAPPPEEVAPPPPAVAPVPPETVPIARTDPADDPLDPRWRPRPMASESQSWTASRVGDR